MFGAETLDNAFVRSLGSVGEVCPFGGAIELDHERGNTSGFRALGTDLALRCLPHFPTLVLQLPFLGTNFRFEVIGEAVAATTDAALAVPIEEHGHAFGQAAALHLLTSSQGFFDP